MNCLFVSRKMNCILLTMYLSLILISQILTVDFLQVSYLVIGSFLVVILSAIVAPLLISYFSGFSLPDKVKSKKSKSVELIFYGIPLLVLLLYYIVYFPGAFSPDSIDQYRQAITNQYRDWHPVLHTLIAFKLPLLLGRGWIGSIVLFQILIISFTMGYCFHVVYQYAGIRYTAASMIFVFANPLTCNIAMYPWKDVTFAIGAVLLMAFSFQIFMTQGDWIAGPAHMAAFIVMLVVTTIVRHNGLLFTIPLLVAVSFQIPPRRILPIVVIVIFLTYAVKGPLYTYLSVESPGKRQVETLGLPMTIIGAAVKYVPEKIDDEILDFAYQVAPPEIWEKHYSYGDFNAVKFWGETNTAIIEQYGSQSVIRMAFMCFGKDPRICIKAFIKLTEGVYTITDRHPVSISPDIADNSYGISFLSPIVIRLLPKLYNYFIRVFFPHIFLYYGVMHLAVIVSALSKSKLNSFLDWKKILLVSPMFFYNYGTSLLLTSNSDSPRFFYYVVLIFPLLLLFFYREARFR